MAKEPPNGGAARDAGGTPPADASPTPPASVPVSIDAAFWAALSAEAETRPQELNPRLAPIDWKSGDRLWLVNLFAPFGNPGDTILISVDRPGRPSASGRVSAGRADGRGVSLTRR
jgi:hypothetical protein